MNLKSMFATSTALILIAGASHAGGAVAPVVEAEPIMMEPAPVASDWAGAYVGGSLNYTFGADDEIGIEILEDGESVARDTDLGDANLEGVSAGIHAGYRWQRDKWVYGPELGIEAGSVDHEIDIMPFGTAATAESEMNYLVTLVMKTGYEVMPGTLVYGTFGVAHGDFDYNLSVDGMKYSDGYTATGVAAGLGVERKINDKMSVFASYQYRDLSKETARFTDDNGDVAETKPTTAHSNIRLGVNYRF
ncbi:outer membrane protein [Paracoccus indicus]|uniref:outer membrane protein n=1 Tax=Paracoccus indicus TaxID=2079229 RepID=UPI0013B39F16|nr:outer membrane beta-barrel protein [Paracoccus indicus]